MDHVLLLRDTGNGGWDDCRSDPYSYVHFYVLQQPDTTDLLSDAYYVLYYILLQSTTRSDVDPPLSTDLYQTFIAYALLQLTTRSDVYISSDTLSATANIMVPHLPSSNNAIRSVG